MLVRKTAAELTSRRVSKGWWRRLREINRDRVRRWEREQPTITPRAVSNPRGIEVELMIQADPLPRPRHRIHDLGNSQLGDSAPLGLFYLHGQARVKRRVVTHLTGKWQYSADHLKLPLLRDWGGDTSEYKLKFP